MKFLNKKKLSYLFLFLLLSFVYLNCNRADLVNSNNPIPFVSRGVYILSEGSFSPGSSKLCFYSIEYDTFYYNIFNPQNLGLFPDGLLYNNFSLFITEQGNFGAPGKIYKTDTNGTVQNSANVGVNPYSLAISDNKIYITNGPAGNVTVLNQQDFGFIKNIPVGVYPQEIIAHNGKVFVCNTSEFGGRSDSTVSVIDASRDSVIAVIELHKDPSSLAITNENKLLAGCMGANGMIFIIDPNSFIKLDSFQIYDGFSRDISVDKNSSDVYFISYNNNIVKLDLINRTNSIFIQNINPSVVYFYGYLFDSRFKRHYVADARNFNSEGYLHIFDRYTGLLKSHVCGIAPRRIILR